MRLAICILVAMILNGCITVAFNLHPANSMGLGFILSGLAVVVALEWEGWS